MMNIATSTNAMYRKSFPPIKFNNTTNGIVTLIKTKVVTNPVSNLPTTIVEDFIDE
jgi:hypothetical protein